MLKQNHQDLQHDQHHDLEILKAVAQAWHSHSSGHGGGTHTNEFDAFRLNFKPKPSRFKVEAMNKILAKENSERWDFGKSLWDSYEIVTVSKRLELGLISNHLDLELDDPIRVERNNRESKNSLRNLFNRISSGRFSEAIVPRENNVTQF